MVDLSGSRRKVSDERSRELAAKLGIKLFETSAKTGKGISEQPPAAPRSLLSSVGGR